MIKRSSFLAELNDAKPSSFKKVVSITESLTKIAVVFSDSGISFFKSFKKPTKMALSSLKNDKSPVFKISILSVNSLNFCQLDVLLLVRLLKAKSVYFSFVMSLEVI